MPGIRGYLTGQTILVLGFDWKAILRRIMYPFVTDVLHFGREIQKKIKQFCAKPNIQTVLPTT